MKLTLSLILLCMTQIALAKSLNDRRVKEEMLTRVETLIEKTDAARELVKTEDPVGAFKVIGEIFRIIPDHLLAVGTRMDMTDRRVIRMEQETKMILVYVHQQVNTCAQDNGDHLDLLESAKKLRSMRRAFNKQKRKIRRSEVDFQNTYNYSYEF
jgi:hypothetical protein